MKDVSKVCSLNMHNVRNIFSQLNFNVLREEEYLDKIYFKEETFRKISKYFSEILSLEFTNDKIE